MSTINGVVFKNMTHNGQKVKKWNHNGVQVFSAGSTVTYYVDSNEKYVEEVDSDATCLSPKTFTPTKSGWTFVGWREDKTASSSVLNNKVMGSDPITLYAVFKQDVTLTTVANGTSPQSTKQRYYNNGNSTTPTFTVSNPTKSGATFLGWSTGNDTTVEHTNISNMALTANTTLYAVFKYADSAVSRQFHNKSDAFMPGDGWAIPNGYMTLVSSVDFSKYSGITIAFDSVNLTQEWSTNTVYLVAECGGTSVDLYSDYYDYTETHHKTATSGSATLNFTKSSGSAVCRIGFRGDGYCSGGSFGASGTLLGRTVVG